jgi:tetratricopeptide (TPR) repeat protein
MSPGRHQVVVGSATVEQPRYWAFISYSHRDTLWANWLHKSLESYRPPRQLIGTQGARGPIPKRMSPVFRDREELASATDLGTVLTAALAASACQIVICSPQAAKSKWVNEEILAFKRLGREDRIFCLIVAGEPNASDMPGREAEECFPPALRYKLAADGTLSSERTEPIAADVRPGKDGKQNGKLKLIAGVLGVGFDALRRREQQRRNRRLALVASGATVGMLITTSLAAYALIEKRAADLHRARAEAEAETARQTTNFMVDLFKISDPSEARGNAITAREMLDKGAARIDRELSRQPQIRATLLDTVGTVYMGLGLYRDAKPLLDKAVAARRGTSGVPPLELSESLAHLGELSRLQADFDNGERDFRDAVAIQSAQPDDRQAQAELAVTLHGLGELLEDKGSYTQADLSLRHALDLQRKLYGDSNVSLARTSKDIARVMDKAGDLAGAIPVMRDALKLDRELLGSAPHPDTAEALNDLAMLLEENGDYAESESLLREAIAMKRRLLGDRHREIAAGLNNLAAVLQEKGDLPEAEATFREALAMQRAVLGAAHPDVAATLNNLAFVQSGRGDTRGALATEREALGVYRQVFPGDHPEVARIMNRIGFWQTEAGDLDAASQNLMGALEMRRRLLGAKHPDVGTSLVHVAILQVAQHRYQDAFGSAHGAVEILSSSLSATHWKTAVAESAEGAALAGLGDAAQAQSYLTRSVAILSKDGGAPPEYLHLAQRYLDRLHARPGRAGGGS